MNARSINFIMVFIAVLLVVITAFTACVSLPEPLLMPEMQQNDLNERLTGLNVTELPLFKNKALPDKWKVGSERLPDSVLMQAPPGDSAIKLVGTLSSNDCQSAIAIIEIKGIQQIYGCAERIKNDNEKIVRIFADKVVIDNNGYYESLQIDNN